MPNKSNNVAIFTIGIILSFATFAIVMILAHSFFFERKNFFNRIALYKYLKESNSLPQPRIIGGFSIWVVDGHEITLAPSGKWYVRGCSELEICSFVGGVIDRYIYNEIKSTLVKSVLESTHRNAELHEPAPC